MNNHRQPDTASPYFSFQKRGLFCLWITIVIYVALSEAEIIPTSFLGRSAETKYFSDIVSIITAIGGSFLAYSLPSWKRVAAILEQPTTAQSKKKQAKWISLRLFLLCLATLPSIFCYYSISFTGTSLYSFFIAVVASILCFPFKSKDSEQ